MAFEENTKPLTTAAGAPVTDNQNSMSAGPRGPLLLQDRVADREARPLRPRGHPRAAHARQGFRRLRHVPRDPRHHPVHEGRDLQPGRQQLRDVRPVLHGGRRARRRRRRARHPRLRAEASTPTKATGMWSATTRRCSSIRDPLKFPDLNRAVKRDPRTNMRDPENNWGFWTILPESLHQVTIAMSDRGIPRSFRHMHGYGSHAYSLINAEGQRHWVKFHFRTQQGIEYLTDAEAGELIGRDRESHRRDLFEAIERGDYPKWSCVHPADARSRRRDLPLPPLRPDQGVAPAGLPADRGRRIRAQPQPGELLRRRRAGRVHSVATSSRESVVQPGQDAAGPAVLLRRRAALPAGRQPPPDPGQRRALPGAQLPPRRRHARRRQPRRSRIIEPNSFGRGRNSRPTADRRSAIGAAADHWNFREDDDDYYKQPGDLFRLMTREQQQALFDNTARAIKGARTQTVEQRTSGTAPRPTPPTAKACARRVRPSARCDSQPRPSRPNLPAPRWGRSVERSPDLDQVWS